jgi:hypothetical protein
MEFINKSSSRLDLLGLGGFYLKYLISIRALTTDFRPCRYSQFLLPVHVSKWRKRPGEPGEEMSPLKQANSEIRNWLVNLGSEPDFFSAYLTTSLRL